MERIHELPPAIQDRLPAGPALTDWLLAELNRADFGAVRMHALGREATCRGPDETFGWLNMMRALVLKHRARPTYVSNAFDPTEPDVPSGWHCLECGLERDGSTDDWPCEVLVMIATILWQAQRPSMLASWAWSAPEDQLIWRQGGADGHTSGAERESIEADFMTYDGADQADDRLGDENRSGT